MLLLWFLRKVSGRGVVVAKAAGVVDIAVIVASLHAHPRRMRIIAIGIVVTASVAVMIRHLVLAPGIGLLLFGGKTANSSSLGSGKAGVRTGLVVATDAWLGFGTQQT